MRKRKLIVLFLELLGPEGVRGLGWDPPVVPFISSLGPPLPGMVSVLALALSL